MKCRTQSWDVKKKKDKNARSLTTWVIKALRTEVNAGTWDNVNPVRDPKRNF